MNIQQSTFSQRSFLLKIYVVSMFVVGCYLALYPFLKPTVLKLALIAAMGVAFIVGYLVSRLSKGFVRSSHYYIVCCYVLLLANILIGGGIGTPGIIWLLICPLIAFLTLSTKVARVWLIIIIATVLLLFAFDKSLTVEQPYNQKLWYLVSYIFFFPIVYAILRIFRKEVSKKNIELNVLNQELQSDREELEKTQQEILLQSARIKEAETAALERSSKLSYYLDQLIEVKRMEEVHSGNLDYSLQAILHFLQKSMGLKEVALWCSFEQGQFLRLLGQTGDEKTKRTLFREDFPDAYDMLQTGAILTASDNSKEALQLKHLFQIQAGDDSIITCPYFLEGHFAGFISCRASAKTWAAEDIIFVRAISDTISLAFKSHQRILEQQTLEEKQLEITEINESLERKVMERTIELNRRNKQLTDFAFTNAHLIRGPICRLLGLQNVLLLTKDCTEVLMIAEFMSLSINELDSITRKTSGELNAIVDDSYTA
jgi:hypothetical protein